MADEHSQNSQEQLFADLISPIKSPSTSFQPSQQQLLFNPMVQQGNISLNFGNFVNNQQNKNLVKQEAYQIQLSNMNLNQMGNNMGVPSAGMLNEVSPFTPSALIDMSSPNNPQNHQQMAPISNITPNSFLDRFAPAVDMFNLNQPPKNQSILSLHPQQPLLQAAAAQPTLLHSPQQQQHLFTPQPTPQPQIQPQPHQMPIQQPQPQPAVVPLHQVPNINLTAHHTQNDVIRIVQGFNKLVTQKQPGGRDNTKHALPLHVIEFDPLVVTQYPDMFSIPGLICKGYVLGYDKVSRNKVILGDAGEAKFTETFSQQGKRYLAQFTNLIVKFSSHLNGQKLALRFILYNTTVNKALNQITFIDSEEFETITKRGQEKAAERRKRKLNEFDTSASVEGVEPPMGLTLGGDLVKVLGRGFNCSPVNQVVVKFGDKPVKEVHVVKRNSIIVETPENEAGYVDVNVWLDKKTPLQSDARFQYIDPNNLMEFQAVRDYMVQRKAESQSQYQGPQQDNDDNYSMGAPQSANASPWMQGKEVDECGFTVLHHACARGYFELTTMLLQSNIDLERRDNFGRSAVFWSLWAGSLPVTELLVGRGAKLDVADEVGDTPLHIAVQQCHTAVTKQLLLDLLKNDTDNRDNAQLILRLLNTKNQAGINPLELAEDFEDESEMLAVLRATKRVCEKRISEASIPVLDMTFKSGPLVAQTLKQAEPGVQCKLCLSNNSIIAVAKSESGHTSRAHLEHSQVLFLIMAKNQQRVEFTLKALPRVEVLQKDGTWVAGESKFFASQSFHVQTTEEAIETINFHFSKSLSMHTFQPYCYCAKPNESVSSPAAESSGEVKKKSKMGMLRQQMEKMSIKSSPAVNNLASLHTLQQL